MQMMNKNGFSRCGENYINRLRKEGAILQRMSIRMPFYLSLRFAVRSMYRSGK